MRPQWVSTFFSLRSQGYPLFGGGAYVVFPDGLLVGGEGEGGGSIKIGEKTNRYAGDGAGFLDLGYRVVSSDRITVDAVAGIGGGGGGTAVGEKDPQRPRRMIKGTAVGTGGGGIRSSIALSFEFHFGFLTIGLRVGLMILPPLLYFGTPQSRLKPFIRLNAGFSGRRG